MSRILALAVFAFHLVATHVAAASPQLIVHEWGTFTSFQDDRGETIAAINVDDEPVPAFVHRLTELPIFTTRSLPARWSQGAPRCHADVTLRLETPVLYFYPQPGFARDQPIEVQASFAGGWLTEFFPWATAENSGFPASLAQTSRGSLRWSGLTLPPNTTIAAPHTAERVWLAPRAVRGASVVSEEKNEAEKYLFYRGVGRVDAPLIVRRRADSLSVSLREANTTLTALPAAWLVHVHPDGRVRYRSARDAQRTSATLPPMDERGPSELDALQREIKAALIDEGLYEDEAEAMLATWRLSYFDSEGLRLFYLLPRAWTDARLPLSISVPAESVRVMLGRVELISPHQHATLEQLYALPDEAFSIEPLYSSGPAVYAKISKQMREGRTAHSALYGIVGREVPEALRLYERLGRFRDALLMHELKVAADDARRKRLASIIDAFSSCRPQAQGRSPSG